MSDKESVFHNPLDIAEEKRPLDQPAPLWPLDDSAGEYRIQKELRPKTELYRRLINSSPLGIIAFDTECRYTVWNPALERMTGLKKEEVLGTVAFDLFTFLKETGEDRHYREALAGKTFTVENRRFIHPVTEREVFFDAHYSPVRDAAGAIIGGVIIITDITERKQAEDALRESEQKYRRLFESSLVGVFTVDLKGNYTSINPSALKTLDCSLEEVIGRSCKKHLAPEMAESVFREYNKMYLTDRPLNNAQYDIITAAGRRRTLESSATVLKKNGRPIGFQATAIDVTDRNQAGEILRVTNMLLQAANRHGRMEPLLNDFLRLIQQFTGCEAAGIRVFDARRQITVQAHSGFSTEFFERVCPAPSEKCSCTMSENASPSGASAPSGLSSPDAAVDPRCHACEFKTAEVIPIAVGERVLGMIQVASRRSGAVSERAISALRQAATHIGTAIVRIQMNETVRQALHVSSRKAAEASALLESSKAVLEYQKFERAAEVIVGSCRNVIGAAIGCVTVRTGGEGNDGDCEEIIILQSTEAGIDGGAGAKIPLSASRSSMYASTRPVIVNHPDQAIQEVVPNVKAHNLLAAPILLDERVAGLLTFLNKTDGFSEEDAQIVGAFAGQAAVALRNSNYLEALRRSETRYRWLSQGLEATVRKKVAELQQIQTLASIGQMVSVVAHEIRNPLQNIYMGVDALRKEIKGDPAKSEILEEINYGIGMLNGIVRELLDYSKPVSLILSDWTADDVISHALSLVSNKLTQVTVRRESRGTEKKARLDAEKMAQVLVNLISNAVDAMPTGGELTVAAEFGVFEGAPGLRLSVSDTGCGIDKDDLLRIQEPFFTTKTHGTGLGISICKKIVLAHNGKLVIKSQKGVGTTVDIFLPA